MASLRFPGRWAPRHLLVRLSPPLDTALSLIKPRHVGESARRACQHEANGVLLLAIARAAARRPLFSMVIRASLGSQATSHTDRALTTPPRMPKTIRVKNPNPRPG